MPRWTTKALTALAVPWFLSAGSAKAEMFSKAYTFKPNTTLEVGADLPGGLRLDTVEFVLEAEDGKPKGTFSGPKVKVGISNLGTAAVKVGVAIAVTDAEGRLVAVASGGTKLFPLRADRMITYTLSIDGVRAELAAGTVFRISIEPM